MEKQEEILKLIVELKGHLKRIHEDIRQKDGEVSSALKQIFDLHESTVAFPSDFFERLDALREQSAAIGEASLAYAKLNRAIRDAFGKEKAAHYLLLFTILDSLPSFFYIDKD